MSDLLNYRERFVLGETAHNLNPDGTHDPGHCDECAAELRITMNEPPKCICRWDLAMGPNLKCPIHGNDPITIFEPMSEPSEPTKGNIDSVASKLRRDVDELQKQVKELREFCFGSMTPEQADAEFKKIAETYGLGESE